MIVQDLLPTLTIAAAAAGFVTLNISLWQSRKNRGRTRNTVWLVLPSLIPLMVVFIMVGSPGGISTLLSGPVVFILSLVAFRRAKVSKWKESVRRDLPTVLDSLVLNVAAGLALMPAFLSSGKILPINSPLREKIDLLKKDIELGTPHAEALERLKAGIGLPGADASFEAIIQAMTLGTPVENVLREQARRMRENMLLEGERFANTLSVKLLAPLFLFILPASFLVILSPVIMALLVYR